jgi:E3 ubiquitin-protein ligase HECTD3
MREGFVSVVPSLVLPLFTWRQIEMKICGNAEIDIDALKKITQFEMPEGEQHPVAIMFWNVVQTFSNDDRAALLGFASGRRRLPAGTCKFVL